MFSLLKLEFLLFQRETRRNPFPSLIVTFIVSLSFSYCLLSIISYSSLWEDKIQGLTGKPYTVIHDEGKYLSANQIKLLNKYLPESSNVIGVENRTKLIEVYGKNITSNIAAVTNNFFKQSSINLDDNSIIEFSLEPYILVSKDYMDQLIHIDENINGINIGGTFFTIAGELPKEFKGFQNTKVDVLLSWNQRAPILGVKETLLENYNKYPTNLSIVYTDFKQQTDQLVFNLLGNEWNVLPGVVSSVDSFLKAELAIGLNIVISLLLLLISISALERHLHTSLLIESDTIRTKYSLGAGFRDLLASLLFKYLITLMLSCFLTSFLLVCITVNYNSFFKIEFQEYILLTLIPFLIYFVLGLFLAFLHSFSLKRAISKAKPCDLSDKRTRLAIVLSISLSIFSLFLLGVSLSQVLSFNHNFEFRTKNIDVVKIELESDQAFTMVERKAATLESYLAGTAGLDNLALSNYFPFYGEPYWQKKLIESGTQDYSVDVSTVDVSTAWFHLLDIELIEGRFFAPGEQGVIIVNEKFVDTYLSELEPIGLEVSEEKIIIQHQGDVSTPIGVSTSSEVIVGVVKDAYLVENGQAIKPMIFAPMENLGKELYLAIDSTRIESSIIRNSLSNLDWNMTVSQKKSVQSKIDLSYQKEISRALQSSIAAILGCIFIFFSIISIQNQRVVSLRKELATRRAIGANRLDIVLYCVKSNFIYFAIGGAVSISMIIAFTNSISTVGFSPPPSYALFIGIVSLITVFLGFVLGTALPTLREINSDPWKSLK